MQVHSERHDARFPRFHGAGSDIGYDQRSTDRNAKTRRCFKRSGEYAGKSRNDHSDLRRDSDRTGDRRRPADLHRAARRTVPLQRERKEGLFTEEVAIANIHQTTTLIG